MNDELTKKQYYERKAVTFDETCVRERDEHYEALAVISMFLGRLNPQSVLDVGCGTGRGIGYLLKNHPGPDTYMTSGQILVGAIKEASDLMVGEKDQSTLKMAGQL